MKTMTCCARPRSSASTSRACGPSAGDPADEALDDEAAADAPEESANGSEPDVVAAPDTSPRTVEVEEVLVEEAIDIEEIEELGDEPADEKLAET